ncbi:hypothetical protein F9C07_1997 [Aspergillus flavus]|uniref:Uncharacterized protein n=1 Tax=Aspergillus flavus (strain ATCC 200026 / FGSC A1120 / IAM 13836 / NRRL 3357 / JCM 12722 / SRRC 167) TaxID=332952 RepID=A0A7U2MG20_ASPFN|nr:hypothetical protein F9C07_1997 [Aspergillus flavus]
MSGNNSGPSGGAPPTGYTGGPPAALQPGGAAPGGYNFTAALYPYLKPSNTPHYHWQSPFYHIFLSHC